MTYCAARSYLILFTNSQQLYRTVGKVKSVLLGKKSAWFVRLLSSGGTYNSRFWRKKTPKRVFFLPLMASPGRVIGLAVSRSPARLRTRLALRSAGSLGSHQYIIQRSKESMFILMTDVNEMNKILPKDVTLGLFASVAPLFTRYNTSRIYHPLSRILPLVVTNDNLQNGVYPFRPSLASLWTSNPASFFQLTIHISILLYDFYFTPPPHTHEKC